MKHFKTKLFLLGVALIGVIDNSIAQSTNPNNNFSLPPAVKFLGWQNNNTNPLLFRSNNADKMMLSGNITNSINGGLPLNREGFLGLGVPTGFFPNVGGQGPFSLLHLNGINPLGQPQTGGYRNWMQYGITSTHNQDLAFFGQRKNGAGSDITDVVIGWADNSAAGAGPDNMVFNFLAGPQGGTNDLNGDALNGREIMRLTAIGNVGIGPRFNNTWQPQSTLHQHQENSASSWMQITNQASPILNNPATNVNGPTAITSNDGLRWGIDPVNIGYIYNQENKHLLFSTNHNAGTSEERMRITHIGAPTTPNPGNTFANDLTRVSISHDPLNPINRPLALLHLGYNTGNALAGTPNGTDGWRNWMEVGTLVSRSTDHVFVGLKPIGNGLINSFNRQDAVIAWGDDYNSPLPIVNTGPDKLRIIFTSPAVGEPFAGPGAMSTADGLEFVRYVPFHNTNLNVNDPRTGFGDFNSLLPVGTIDPGNTVEINSIMNGYNAVANTNVTGSYVGSTGASGLRFRDLTSKSLVVKPDSLNKIDSTKVLTVDTLGNVVLINAKGIGSGNADNGLSKNGPTAGAIHLGQNVAATSDPGKLLNNRQVPMYGKNIYFTGQDSIGRSAIYVGFTAGAIDIAKVNVKQKDPVNNNLTNAAIQGINKSFFTSIPGTQQAAIGIIGISDTTQIQSNKIVNLGGLFNASNARTNAGISTSATNGLDNTGIQVISNTSSGGISNTGININVSGTSNNAQALKGTVNNTSASAINTYGLLLNTSASNGNVYGIFSAAPITAVQNPGSPPNPNGSYAGYFAGDVVRTGTDNFTSDFNLKQNIDTITNALGIIKKLKPKTFEYKQSSFPSMNLPSGKQYGFIAQDVQTILPELVNNNVHPAKLDSAGNILVPSVNFLSLEYQQLIGIMVKAMQQQQSKIDSLTTKLNSKDSIQDARLTALENAINQCCSNAAARSYNSNSNQLDVELSDKDAIVLNQNVPNPFAEQTTITYNVPSSIEKAQLIFFNSNGQVIQTVDIKTRGKGKVNVFASDLSSGLYHYTLVADGKVVDSKKMVRE